MENKAWEQLIQSLVRQRILRSPRVIRALRKVSREQFLPERVKPHANVDSPLPIGFGQTISAPHC